VPYKIFNAAGQSLLDERIRNVVLIMLLVTAILGLILTQSYASGMLAAASGYT